MRTIETARQWLIGASAVALAALAAGCGGQPAEQPKPPVQGTFVGMVGGGPPGVAVVANKPRAKGQLRAVSAYVCDGRAINEWLTGQALGNQVNLSSEDGQAAARVTLAQDSAKGTITLAGGRKLRFTALPASGTAGLYDVTIEPGGWLRGTSQAGGSLTGHLRDATKVPFVRGVSATITAGGSQMRVTAAAVRATPGEYRWIAFANGRAYGGKNGEGKGSITDPAGL
jgi:hypothetical protein